MTDRVDFEGNTDARSKWWENISMMLKSKETENMAYEK